MSIDQNARSADPIKDLQKILTPDEIQDLVDGLFLLRFFWGKPRGHGKLTMEFKPESTLVIPSPERLRKV